MIKPVNKNVLLKSENNQNSIIIMPKEHNDFYLCIDQGDGVCLKLVDKS